MATGNYGNIRPSDVSPNDVEIFVHYTPSRTSPLTTTLTKLDPLSVMKKIKNPNYEGTAFEMFGGLYTLELPADVFGQVGIYTIMIKPIEIRTKIVDCGVLSVYPDIKGLIFDTSTIDSKFLTIFENNGLIGYRVEYISSTASDDRKIPNFFRVITSNNKAEPVNQNLNNTNQKAIRYRFNDNSNLVFCTLTPSSSSNVKPNVLPYIGEPNQEVIITNTYFNPIMIELDVVEHDIQTLAYGIFGNQTKSLEDGIYTIYNFNDQIYKQFDLFEIKAQYTGKPLFEVREERTSIDFTKQFNNIANV